MTCFHDVRIERIGAEGDGVASLADGAMLYLPGTLPGERVRARVVARRGGGWAGEAEVLEASAQRVGAPCPHFGACGGCALQHWQEGAYLAWKAGLLAAALQRAGFDATPAPVIRIAPGSRRRIDLAIRRRGAGVTLGLHARRSTEIVDLHTCPVLHPRVFALLAPLRELLRGLDGLRRRGSALVNLLDSGPDLLLRLDAAPSAADRRKLAGFAAAHGLPRISTAIGDGAPEPAALLRPATLAFSGVSVTPPPGAFLQASAEGEAAITAGVLAGLPRLAGRARIAELHAGCGTLTFALAGRARVAAFEGDAAALAALRHGANHAGLAGRIMASRRDLARQPLTAPELAGFAAVVLDPPDAGARAQVAEIAASAVARVIYVSCSPASLGRDARLLREAGYRLVTATPIDQFAWSPRLESVSVFSRERC